MAEELFSESKLDELWKSVKTFRSKDSFMGLMKACARFRHLAPYNAMLVEMQRPGARYVLSEREWRIKYQRGVRPNSQPIVILIPFGPVDFVFEIGDTYQLDQGLFPASVDEVLEHIAAPYKMRHDVKGKTLDLLVSWLPYHGIAFDTSFAAGTGYAAKIETLDRPSHRLRFEGKGTDIIERQADFLLSINKNAQNGERFASICHELGHLFCHHLSSPKGWKEWKVRDCLSYSAEGFEAEAVSWLICERLNIGNPSEAYLSGYLADNDEIPEEVSVENILYAAKEVWNMCEKIPNYKSGLLYKHCEAFKNSLTQIGH